MNRIIKLTLLIKLVFLTNSCELLKPDHMIAFVNNSDSDVYCPWSSHYPDTLTIQYEAVAVNSYSRVNAHSSTCNIRDGNADWLSIIKNIPSDTLLIFVLDANTVDSIGIGQNWIPIYNSMNEIQLYDWLVKKKYVLSLEDLERLNWTITYP